MRSTICIILFMIGCGAEKKFIPMEPPIKEEPKVEYKILKTKKCVTTIRDLTFTYYTEYASDGVLSVKCTMEKGNKSSSAEQFHKVGNENINNFLCTIPYDLDDPDAKIPNEWMFGGQPFGIEHRTYKSQIPDYRQGFRESECRTIKY